MPGGALFLKVNSFYSKEDILIYSETTLYLSMQIAGLKVESIVGFAKNHDFKPGEVVRLTLFSKIQKL